MGVGAGGEAGEAEHAVAAMEAGHLAPDLVDDAGELDAHDAEAPAGAEQSEHHAGHRGVPAPHHPAGGGDGRGADGDAHLVVARLRSPDLADLEHVGWAVLVAEHRGHRRLGHDERMTNVDGELKNRIRELRIPMPEKH
ncbi:MAG: hypothetical protein QM765_29125 [Myxococcales bacterium]